MADRGSSLMRMRGLLRKEVLQIRRDPSSILLAIVMPVVLLFIFGFGVSLDPQHVPVALVIEDGSPQARDLAARFELSPYFAAVVAATRFEGGELLRGGKVDAIVQLRGDFTADLADTGAGPVQLILNGVDANRARLIEGYARGTIAKWQEIRRARGETDASPPITIEQRIWFNESAESTNFLVPGLLTLIMTLIGTLLTALVIAREWERGTMEALLATPLCMGELLLGKTLPYFALGMGGMGLAVLLSVTLFHVPLRGSLGLLVLFSAIFLLAALGLGLAISATVRVQFVAAQISVVAGFLPAFFLSGLLFDLQSTPRPIQILSHIVPARYYISIGHTIFQAGDIWAVYLPAASVLAVMATLLLTIARLKLRRRLPIS